MFSTLLPNASHWAQVNNSSFTWESTGNCKIFFSACGSLPTSLFAECAVWVLYDSQQFFSTAFETRAWTMVVFRKEKSGRQPQLITLENEGWDNTYYPSPPNITFFDDPEVPFDPQDPQPPTPPEPHEPPGSSGLPPPPSPAGGRERVATRNTPRERLHPRPSPAEPQLIPIPMMAKTTMMNSHHKERGEDTSLDRVSEYIHSHLAC